jgi:CBS domain-containing protein
MSMPSTAGARLAIVAVAQHGVFTRAQATAAGFSAGQIERRLRSEEWTRVLPRVYRNTATPESLMLGYSAALAWAGPECALSHTSAAAIWCIAVAAIGRVEIVVPRRRAPRAERVAVHRVTHLDEVDVRRAGHLRVTTPVRTIIDLAGMLSERDLERAVVSARARGLVTIRALRTRLDAIGPGGRPGAARLGTLLTTIGSGVGGPSARMAG